MSEDSAHGEIDERTPSWAATLDREEFRAELDRVCHAEWSSSPRQIRLRPLKEHINRCTFEIAIETTLGLGVRRPMSYSGGEKSRIASNSRWNLRFG